MCIMKNVTLSIPDDLLKLSREYAKRHGTSLNEFIRELLKKHVLSEGDDPVERLLKNSELFSVSTKSWKWNRDEIYDRKIFS